MRSDQPFNVRPSIAVAHAVLVRSDVDDVGARRPRRQNAVVRLLVGNNDQTVELAPLVFFGELRKSALEIRPRVRLRTNDGVAQSEATARRKLDTRVGERGDAELFRPLAKEDGESGGRVHARGFALFRKLV